MYNDRPVTMIGESAFEEYDMISITIPDSVTCIDSDAFSGCSCLQEVQLGKGLESIGSYAFSDCVSLKSIDFPKSLLTIDYDAFRGCTSLKTVNFNDGLTTIGSYAFSECVSLTSVDFPNSLLTIENDAFSGSGLSNVILPDGIQTLEWRSFETAGESGELVIPDNVDPDIRLKSQSDVSGNIYDCSLALPTGYYQYYPIDVAYDESGTYARFAKDIAQSKPKLKIVVSKDSIAYQQLKAIEEESNIDLQELGIYRVK